MVNIAVVIPSRGQIYSETIDELLRELSGYDYQLFFSHGNPIPDCFEIPTRQALEGDFTHILVVEEDMIIPKHAVDNLLEHDVAAYDYPVDNGHGTALRTNDGGLYSGTGLFMIKTDIVRLMPFPIWRSDIAWDIKYTLGEIRHSARLRTHANYGGQDITMGMRLNINGYSIHILDGAGQRRIQDRGEERANNGSHRINEMTEYSRKSVFGPKAWDNLEIIQDWIYMKPAKKK